jgi:hypothetical protein
MITNVTTLQNWKKKHTRIYLWSKVVCFVCHVEISQPMVLHAMLLVSSKISQWIEVHRLGLRLFGATMWKPLIIEPFFEWKLIKIKTENTTRIWKLSWCYWKPLSKSDLIEFISQFPQLRCERYWFLRGFCCWEIQTNCKNWVWKEKSVEPSRCSHLGQPHMLHY